MGIHVAMGIRGTVNADSAFHPAMENREDKGLEAPQDVATQEKAALGVQTDPVKHAEVQETAGEGGKKAESPEAVTKYDVGVGVSDGDQPVGVVTVEGKEEGPSCTCPKEGPRTSEYYQIRNKVPKRFDHPGMMNVLSNSWSMSPRFLVDLVHEARGPQARGLSTLNQLETEGSCSN